MSVLLFHHSFIGPSRRNHSFRLRRYIDALHSDEFLTESSSDDVKNGASDDGMRSDLDFSFNTDFSEGMEISSIFTNIVVICDIAKMFYVH